MNITQEMLDAGTEAMLAFRKSGEDWTTKPAHAAEAAIRAALNHRHSGGDGEDSARLDYIERTFSGMTNRERYLPVVMIWGKGANGRTLREACDKYRAKDAARAGESGGES